MAESFEFDPADWITAGAVGEPGHRTFYVQARKDDRYVSILVEKGQVAALSQLAQEILVRVDVVVTPDDLQADELALIDGLVPAWRAGSMSLGMDPEGDRFLLEARELVDDEDEDADPAQARLWMSRDQLVALAAYAAWAVEAGARDRCKLCGRPVDADGHVCPATNGHGSLTV